MSGKGNTTVKKMTVIMKELLNRWIVMWARISRVKLSNVLRKLMRPVVRINMWICSTQKMIVVPQQYASFINEAEMVINLKKDRLNLCEDYQAQLLRKYAHILDKGLQNINCESGHGKKFYLLAKEALSRIKSPELLLDPSIAWAIKKIRIYEKLQTEGTLDDSLSCEYIKTCCKYEDMVDAIKTRRSIRSYSNKTVSRTDISKVVEVIIWAPQSCNRQVAVVFATTSPVKVYDCLAVCKGATNFSDNVPCFLSFCADLRSYRLPRELFLPTIDIGLGLQNCCLIAHTLGMSLTFLNWEQHSSEEDKKLRSVLDIPEHYRIVINGVLGYPERGAPVPLRKDLKATCVIK